MTYEARLVAPPPPKRRPVVGPPPSVARYTDVFHQFCIDPVSQAQNPQMLAPFLSDMGKIYSRSVTGLTSRSQRKLGKAIRRAKMMGVIPILSKPKYGIFYGSSKRRMYLVFVLSRMMLIACVDRCSG
jgi:small subunit ribosomal protein S18